MAFLSISPLLTAGFSSCRLEDSVVSLSLSLCLSVSRPTAWTLSGKVLA